MALGSDFVWGVATSAFQIEGSTEADGRGPSIWDTHYQRGLVPDPPDPACDHYRRYREDVGLMADLGVDAYRFSIAWPRILPDGETLNPAGLAFYDRLIDELLGAGIEPWPTLYHWDLPQALQDQGGWADRSVLRAFERYAGVVTARLGDRVGHWMTHNEPWVAAMLGHKDGVFAPGISDWNVALRAGHHILVSHGLAAAQIRQNVSEALVGIALDCRPAFARSESTADQTALRHFDGFRNRWFFDPVFGKGYPEDMVDAYDRAGRFDGSPLDFVAEGDMELIATPIDFLGVNYYTSIVVTPDDIESEVTAVAPDPDPPPGHTEMGWANTPDAFTDFLVRVSEEYSPAKIVITENGASYSDGPNPEGQIHDERRIEYLSTHIDAVESASLRGVPMAGYFVWSLLDNLEWTSGFSQRFGLVYVDHATGTRLPKDSYHWYRERIATEQVT